MNRSSVLFMTPIMVVALSFLTGCNDELKAKEAHIALIEDANQQLTGELSARNREVDELARQRDDLNAQLLAARQEAQRLHGELSAQPEPTLAAPTAAGWQPVPGGAMIAVEGSVLFASGKKDLLSAGRSTLDSIGSTIRSRYGDKDIFVFGHTDDTPIRKSGWKDNYELSAQRALTVVRYFGRQGLSPRSLIACAAGEHRPRTPNNSEANRAKNRRVEIYALDKLN